MSHDSDLSDARISRNAAQRFFECVAGGVRALPVVDIFEKAPA